MDTFFESVPRSSSLTSEGSASCYADDVLLLAKSHSVIKSLLHYCTQWARQSYMTWSVGKFTTITAKNTTFRIALQPIPVSNKAVYLGVTITSKGLSTHQNVKRLEKAEALLYRMKRLSIRVTILVKRAVATGTILPVVDYRSHLLPLTPIWFARSARFEANLLRWVFDVYERGGTRPINTSKASLLIRMPSINTRVQDMIDARIVKLQAMTGYVTDPTLFTLNRAPLVRRATRAYQLFLRHSSVLKFLQSHPILRLVRRCQEILYRAVQKRQSKRFGTVASQVNMTNPCPSPAKNRKVPKCCHGGLSAYSYYSI